MKKILGIYIHIPFCKNKCNYCDFVSFKNNEEKQEEYIKCLIKEIEHKNWNYINEKYDITTIYIGGGTPSYISYELILKVMQTVNSKINCKMKEIEITIEVNPGTANFEKLTAYKNIGINRLSIGLQSTNNKILKKLGRIHNYEQFLETYKLAREIGYDNINVDLMIGLPSQTIQDLKESLENVVELKPNHISVYSLILEEGTKFYKMYENQELDLPKEELERQMYWYVKNKLELARYKHYEISNFAENGKESKHNINCWNQEEYLGFGLAAHSYFENKRFSNISDLNLYIENIKNKNFEKNMKVHEIQSILDKKKEFMLLGLRKIDGVSISKFKEKFVDNPIYIFKNELSEVINDGLVEIDVDNIRLTNKGLDFANLVWEKFI